MARLVVCMLAVVLVAAPAAAESWRAETAGTLTALERVFRDDETGSVKVRAGGQYYRVNATQDGLGLSPTSGPAEVPRPSDILPQSEIARERGTSQPNVTQLLHALEKDGLVERVIYPENRRVTYARLKPEGVALCDVLVPDMVQFMQSSMLGLSTDELAELHRLLAQVRARAEQLLTEG